MFERFTEHARQVVIRAQEEARALRHNYIGTEHILLGLTNGDEGDLSFHVLIPKGITVEQVRAQVVRIVGTGEEVISGHLPFTRYSRNVLEMALRESLGLGHNYIGTEHILLGLIRENEGMAARILIDLGAEQEEIRDDVIRMLAGAGGRRRPTVEDSTPSVTVLQNDDGSVTLMTPAGYRLGYKYDGRNRMHVLPRKV